MCSRAEPLLCHERALEPSSEASEYELRKEWQLKCGDVPGMGELPQDRSTISRTKAGSQEVAEQIEPWPADRGVRGDATGQTRIVAFTHDCAP